MTKRGIQNNYRLTAIQIQDTYSISGLHDCAEQGKAMQFEVYVMFTFTTSDLLTRL